MRPKNPRAAFFAASTRPLAASKASPTSTSAGSTLRSRNYTRFCGIHPSTGALPPNRFPGQWFQSESGLHQNWMRDYDPTTGRYLQADPLGLIDCASVYGYAGQSPMMNVDPNGQCFGPLIGLLPACMGAAAFVLWGWPESDECNPYTWGQAGWDAFNGAMWGWAGGAAWKGAGAAWKTWNGWRAAGAAGGNWTVYQGIGTGVDAGIVRYAGITSRDVAIRGAEHAADSAAKAALDYAPFATGLTKQAARKIERQLINQFGLGKNGGTLLNKINSIAPKYWTKLGIK